MSILYVQKLTLLIVCNLFFITCVTAQKPELQKSYYPNGNIKSSGYSKDGYKEGVWKEYFETGEISSVYHYQEGRIHGDIKTYFKNGQVYVSRTFSNGFRVGEHKWYHDNGKLQTVGHYSNDVQVGEWKRYDENGTLDNTEMFYNINREAAISDLELRGVSTYTKNGVKETRVDLKNLKSNIGARIHPPGHSSAFYLKDDRGKRYELIGQESWPGDGPNGFGRTGKSVLNLVVSLKFEYVPIDQVKRLDLVEGDCKSGCWHLYNILSTNRTISYDSDMCMSGDCTNGEGLYKWSNGDTYEGTFKYGKPEGQGVYNLANGDKYEGEFKNGKEEGKGIIYLANGDKIEGSFENNLIRYGTFYGSNGETYSGSWSDGLPGGSGTYTFPNGEKYDGQFAKGKYSGYGTFHYKDGSQYIGLYQNGSIHGDGVYYPKSGEMYVGAYAAGKRTSGKVYSTAEEKAPVIEKYFQSTLEFNYSKSERKERKNQSFKNMVDIMTKSTDLITSGEYTVESIDYKGFKIVFSRKVTGSMFDVEINDKYYYYLNFNDDPSLYIRASEKGNVSTTLFFEPDMKTRKDFDGKKGKVEHDSLDDSFDLNFEKNILKAIEFKNEIEKFKRL